MSKESQKKELVKINKKLNNLYKDIFKKKNVLSENDYSSFYKDGISIDYDRITTWSIASMYFDIRTKKDLEKFISKSKKLVKEIKSKFIIEFVGHTEFLSQFKKKYKTISYDEKGNRINDILEKNIPVSISIIVRKKDCYTLGHVFKCDELFFDETKDYNDESYKPLKRHLKYQEQRKNFKDKHGFDPAEVWTLSSTIAMFILPRLIRLKEVHHGLFWESRESVKSLDEKQTNEVFDKMIKAFYWIIIRERTDCMSLSKIKEDEIQEGLNLFAKHFNELWD